MLNSHNLREHRKLLLHTWADEDIRKEILEKRMAWPLLFMLCILFWVVLFTLLPGCSMAKEVIYEPNIAGYSLNKWCEAIKRTEGDKYYGIKSIKVENEAQALKICQNTVRNNFKRFKSYGGNSSDLDGFVEFIGNRYCPKSADYQGNINWKHNMIKLLKQ